MKFRNQLLISASLLGCWVAAGPAFAQDAGASASEDTLGEVVVTAERRTSTAQRTPAAVTVKSGEDMAAQGRYTLRNIIEDVPGVTGGEAVNAGTSLGSGTDNAASGLVFRGIPSNFGTGGSVTSTASAAAIYVDDIYNGVGGGYDFERVEVLRGPQGTLYGRSATSGVVAIHTRGPNTSEFDGDIALETGTAGLKHYTGGVNVPLVTDKLALRVSGNYYDREGYRISPGDDRRTRDLRAKLLLTPMDNLSILLGYAQQYNDTQSGGGSYNQPTPDTFAFAPTIPAGTYSNGENIFHQYWANVKWDLGAVTVTYIPAVRKWEQDAILSITGMFTATQTILTPESKFTTHELRLNSNNDSALQWQFGASHYDNQLSDFNEFVALPPTPSPGLRFRTSTKKSTKAYGAFGEATWSFQPDTRLTAGLRFDHTEVQTDQDYTSITLVTKSISGDAGFRDFDNVTYKVRLEHDLTPSNLLYAGVSTGFSPGDVTLGTDATLAPVVVLLDAETLTAYEVGSKNRFLDNRLQLNGAIYYNDYSAYQLANVNFGTPAVPAFLTVAVPLTSLGAELELLARPWTGGTLGVNLSYTDAKFDVASLPVSPSNYQAQFYTDRVYGIPKLRSSVSYDHRLEFGGNYALMLHGDVVYTSEYDTQRIQVPDAAAGFKPYVNRGALALGNLSATLQFAEGRYGITGYVRNVTDKEYKTLGNGPSPPVSFTGSANLGDPRTWGAILTARF